MFLSGNFVMINLHKKDLPGWEIVVGFRAHELPGQYVIHRKHIGQPGPLCLWTQNNKG